MKTMLILPVVALLGCQSNVYKGVVPEEDTGTRDVDDDGGEDTDDVQEDTDELEDTSHTGWVDTAPPVDTEYDLSIQLTADDAWVLWVNDTRIGEAVGWQYTDIHDSSVSLYQDGDHVIAVHAYDVYGVISGFIAAVTLDGVPKTVTGDGQWKMTTTQPPVNWTRAQFDDSSWVTPEIVDSTKVSYYWKNRPTDLIDAGAQWVWDSPSATPKDVWFRYVFSVP